MPSGWQPAIGSGARLVSGVRRLRLLGAVVAILLAALLARLWYLQVLASERYTKLAAGNRVREVVLPAPRGLILDRTGRVLAGNRAAWAVTVDLDAMGTRNGQILGRLATLLHVPRGRIEERLRGYTGSPYLGVPIAEDIPQQVLFYLSEHAEAFPGVATQVVLVRDYPNGTAAAHMLGYTGQVTAAELTKPASHGVRPGDLVGQAGVEQTYDRLLRGHDGAEQLEVTATGRVAGVLGATPPVPGDNLQLTVDLSLQQRLDADLARQITTLRHTADPKTGRAYPAPGGAAVVLDPRDGSVLALSSYPTYDPTVWVGGISQANYQRLTSHARHDPLLNRAIAGLYAPGSTFKLATATTALDDGLIGPDTVIDDPGSFTIPGCSGPGSCTFHNSEGEVLGPLDVTRALSASDDVFFYTLGYQFWSQRDRYGPEPIQQVAHDYGLGTRSGIALPGEATGRVDSPNVRASLHARDLRAFPEGGWFPGDNVELAFGQGGTVITPLQLAGAYATFANGGSRFQPRLAGLATDQSGAPVASAASSSPFVSKVTAHVPLPAGVRDALLSGFVGAVQQPGGTAFATFQGFPFDRLQVAGKTGTASVTGREPTAWFACFAPVSQPRVAMAVAIEQAGFGAVAAAPIARDLLRYLTTHAIPPLQPTQPKLP